MDKEDKRQKYEIKKHHDGKNKTKKQTNNQDQEIILQMISNATITSLYSFLQNKYDADRISKYQHKVNNAIIKKLQQFRDDFKLRSIEKIINAFETYAKIKISKETAQHIFDKKQFPVYQQLKNNKNDKQFDGIDFNDWKKKISIRNNWTGNNVAPYCPKHDKQKNLWCKLITGDIFLTKFQENQKIIIVNFREFLKFVKKY